MAPGRGRRRGGIGTVRNGGELRDRIVPNAEFRQDQTAKYVEFQKSVGDVTGHSVSADVVQGKILPYWAPADELFVVGD